jgi:hypothetical protein
VAPCLLLHRDCPAISAAGHVCCTFSAAMSELGLQLNMQLLLLSAESLTEDQQALVFFLILHDPSVFRCCFSCIDAIGSSPIFQSPRVMLCALPHWLLNVCALFLPWHVVDGCVTPEICHTQHEHQPCDCIVYAHGLLQRGAGSSQGSENHWVRKPTCIGQRGHERTHHLYVPSQTRTAKTKDSTS